MNENQRLKMMYLAKIFRDHTDEDHALTMEELIELLRENEISAERKMLYEDIRELKQFGLDIITRKEGRKVYYFLGSREFELAEVKLIIDSVQAAKFISARKSKQLIKKLTGLMSEPQAKDFRRQILLSGRVKTMNESVYYAVDLVHTAIGKNQQISFQYTQWNLQKKMEPRHKGLVYHVSPWYLIWDDEYYYLVAYDSDAGKIKHFRLDKMIRLSILEKKREGKDALKDYDASAYSKQHFGMFGGQKRRVILRCENSFIGIIIDRFGQEVEIYPSGEGHFEAHVDVVVSDQFFGWLVSLGKGVRLIAPESVREDFQSLIRSLED